MKKSKKILFPMAAVLGTSFILAGCGETVKVPEFSPSSDYASAVAEFKEATRREKGVLDDYPLLVGGMAHGKEFIGAFADLKMGNFVWIPKQGYSLGNTDWKNEDYATDAEYAVSRGMYYMASHARGLGDAFKKGGFTAGGDTHAVTPRDPEIIDRVVSAGADGGGRNRFVGWHAEELDADLVQNARLAFGARLPKIYDFTDELGGRISYENELIRLQKIANDMKGNFISNQLVTHHLNAFRANNDVVIAELMEHGVNTELQLAYLRGGRNMFGNSWGVWISPWYFGEVPAADTGLFANEYASLTGGHKTASYRHAVYESYVSGAQIITNQETEPLIARDLITGEYKDVLWGTELKNFWEYVEKYQNSKVESANKTAVMIDRDNGWEVARLWQNWYTQDTNWGKLAQTTGNNMLAQYLNVLLPGYGRTVQQVQNRTDLYPGYFASTPLGSFDMVASDASAESLEKYDNVVMLGEIKMNDTLNGNLKKFVRGGGNLVMTAYQSMANGTFYEDPEFYGYTFQDFKGMNYSDRLTYSTTIRKLISSQDTSLNYVQDTYTSEQFWALLGVVGTADVLAVESSKNQPVLVANEYGRGKVYLGLTEWMMDEKGNMMDFYADTIRSVILNSSPDVYAHASAVDGTGDFSYQVSYRMNADGTRQMLVLLSHYGTKDGYATIDFNEFLDIDKDKIVLEISGGEGYNQLEIKESNGLNVTLKLKAEDLALLSIGL